MRVPAGTSWGFLDLVADDGREVMGKFGWELAGAWSTAMAGEREVILLWTIESWEAWAEFEGAQRADPVVRGWNEQVRERSEEWNRILLVDAPLCPFRTGRQPQASDRDSYRLPDVPG